MFISNRQVDQIRDFNRFYTRVIGVLDDHILESPFSLSEARIIFEINKNKKCTAKFIKDTLAIDEGYLSRILEKLVKAGTVKKTKSSTDGRSYALSLTAQGKKQFAEINSASNLSVKTLTQKLSHTEVDELIRMMGAIRKLLSRDI